MMPVIPAQLPASWIFAFGLDLLQKTTTLCLLAGVMMRIQIRDSTCIGDIVLRKHMLFFFTKNVNHWIRITKIVKVKSTNIRKIIGMNNAIVKDGVKE